ncbi:MAG: hypothetical protein XE11_2802 [Methanomicrobiales archaeon 53_19]|nr:MAG: hypothetical protein XE11_2802 [Methanomicrobiales archaeon 53_19]
MRYPAGAGELDWRRGSLAVLLIAVVCMVVTLFWPGGEVHVIDAASGRIIFCENVATGTHPLGRAWIDSDLNETVASPGADIVTGLGRNTFTATCTNRNYGPFDPARASFTLTVRDVAGRPYSESVALDRAGTKTLSVSFVAEEAGEGKFLISAASIR